MDLSPEQLDYLRRHEIPLSSLFDATGINGASLKLAMEAEGKFFAYNASPCSRGGHSLKTRAGGCIQCAPASIGFTKRYFAEGYVYIAVSTSGRLLKVGTTAEVERRRYQLNFEEYGGQRDWQIITFAQTANMGRVESAAHQRLEQYKASGVYVRAGKRTRCYELFKCNFSDARDAVEKALGANAVLQLEVDERALCAFNFR